MLEAVSTLAPDIYNLAHSAYSSSSFLFWGEHQILSAEGVQQGDPLGPLLFCLTLFHLGQGLSSDLCILYLDDVTIGGNLGCILSDLELIKGAKSLGLILNNSKSEIISASDSTLSLLLSHLPGAQLLPPSQASLLGSPLGDENCMSAAIMDKVEALQRMGNHLSHLAAHDALLLLRSSFAIPKLLYLLRSAPCFSSPSLMEYDSVLMSVLGDVTNTLLDTNSAAWLQASLPVRLGGLGVRRAMDVAPSAFLSSVHATAQLAHAILSSRSSPLSSPSVQEAVSVWFSGTGLPPPSGEAIPALKRLGTIQEL